MFYVYKMTGDVVKDGKPFHLASDEKVTEWINAYAKNQDRTIKLVLDGQNNKVVHFIDANGSRISDGIFHTLHIEKIAIH